MTEQQPELHAFVYDEARERVGEVVEVRGGHVALRPPRGGSPWWTKSVHLRPVRGTELLRARLEQVNRNSIIGFP